MKTIIGLLLVCVGFNHISAQHNKMVEAFKRQKYIAAIETGQQYLTVEPMTSKPYWV